MSIVVPSRVSFTSAFLCATALAAGCGDSASAPVPGLPSPGLAVLSSNYKVSSVGLYDPTSGRVVDNCLSAGDLSKDVALPTGKQNGELVVLDREHAVVDFFDPLTCARRGELSVSTGGFKSNPHDIVFVSTTKAYVTRYETNAAATTADGDFDEGDDVLVIDPMKLTITKRIEMTSHAVKVPGATIQARPDRAVLADGKVYVTLNNIDALFSAAGAGRVVIIDPATDTVTAEINLPDQTGCSGLEYVEATKRLFVSCGGEFSDADQTAKSALVEIDLSGATPVIGTIVKAKDAGTQPFTYANPAIVGTTAYTTTMGALDFTSGNQTAPDSLLAVSFPDGTTAKVVDGGAFTYGRPAASGTKLFLPDGNDATPLVRTFDLSGAAPAAGATFEPNPAGHLPPREVAAY